MLEQLREIGPAEVVLVQTEGHHVSQVTAKAAVVGQPRRRAVHHLFDLLERRGPLRVGKLARWAMRI